MTKKMEELSKLSKPLIDWINTNYHPHVKIIVDCNSAEVVEGILRVTDLYDEQGQEKHEQ
jgi:hypothetical protein